MTEESGHRALRLLLGGHVLGHLDPVESAELSRHLEGCAGCRAELAELAPVAQALAGVDPQRAGVPGPPAPVELEARVVSAVAAARASRDSAVAAASSLDSRRAARRRGVAVLAAAASLVVAVGVGVAVGRGSVDRVSGPVLAGPAVPSVSGTPMPVAPAVPAPGVLPLERVSVTEAAGITVAGGMADVVAHTWGVEARIVASGFVEGAVYRASFVGADGAVYPAGEFLGVGGKPLLCNMQAAVLRGQTRGFVVTDASGATVLAADVPAV